MPLGVYTGNMHDALFKEVFAGNAAMFKELLSLYLSPDELRLVRRLRAQPTDYVSHKYKEVRLDALFAFEPRLNKVRGWRRHIPRVNWYVLAEHKSSTTRSLYPQLKSYHDVVYKEYGGPIIVVVLCHGNAGRQSIPVGHVGHSYGIDPYAVLEGNAAAIRSLCAYAQGFRVLVINLGKISDDVIRRCRASAPVLLAMKYYQALSS